MVNYNYFTKKSLIKFLIQKNKLNEQDELVQQIQADLKGPAKRPTTSFRQQIEEIGNIYRPTNPDFDTIERLIAKINSEIYEIRLKKAPEDHIGEE